MDQNLNKFIDISLSNNGGILKWIRVKDSRTDSFTTPPCFSVQNFLNELYKEKAKVEITNDRSGSVIGEVFNPVSGEREYVFIFTSFPQDNITLN